jgi:hypothetical protein
MIAIQEGMRLRVIACEAGVFDLSQRADIPAVMERLQNMRVCL